jgi:proline-rich protein PRCC
MLPEGVVIKEISGASLRGHGSESIADTSGMRAALGDEYEKKLRSEAARVGNVSKLAKRKNQLSSLFVDAKAQEIEQMEKQASGVKTKTETQRKYGW